MNHWITLLRHGESKANKAAILQGQVDSPLSDSGKHQASQVGQNWLKAGVHFDHVISSPLKRAMDTARIIASILDYRDDIEINQLWKERSFGEYDGKSFNQIKQIQPPVDYFQPYLPIGGAGESQIDLYIRAVQGLQELIRGDYHHILVVSHGALIGKVLFAVLGITPQGHHHSPVFHLGNTAYINLRYSDENRQWIFYGIRNPDEWAGMEGTSHD